MEMEKSRSRSGQSARRHSSRLEQQGEAMAGEEKRKKAQKKARFEEKIARRAALVLAAVVHIRSWMSLVQGRPRHRRSEHSTEQSAERNMS